MKNIPKSPDLNWRLLLSQALYTHVFEFNARKFLAFSLLRKTFIHVLIVKSDKIPCNISKIVFIKVVTFPPPSSNPPPPPHRKKKKKKKKISFRVVG